MPHRYGMQKGPLSCEKRAFGGLLIAYTSVDNLEKTFG
jgi:hypothetical protein